MKKFYILVFLVFSTFSNTVKTEPFNNIKISFDLAKKKEDWGGDFLNKESIERLNLLKDLSEIQKNRNLTIEELNLAYCVLICIFSEIQKNYSAKASITLNDKNILKLPFSSDFLLSVMMKIIEDQEELEKDLDRSNTLKV